MPGYCIIVECEHMHVVCRNPHLPSESVMLYGMTHQKTHRDSRICTMHKNGCCPYQLRCSCSRLLFVQSVGMLQTLANSIVWPVMILPAVQQVGQEIMTASSSLRVGCLVAAFKLFPSKFEAAIQEPWPVIPSTSCTSCAFSRMPQMPYPQQQTR